MDFDVARAGSYSKCGTPAVDVSNYVMSVQVAAHQDSLGHTHCAGAGVGIKGKVSLRAKVKADRTRSRVKHPVRGKGAADLDVAGASSGVQSAGDGLEPDGSGAGLSMNVGGYRFREFDITGARAQRCRAMYATSTYRAGSTLRVKSGATSVNSISPEPVSASMAASCGKIRS